MIIHSIKGAADFLGCSQKTIRRFIENGEMPNPIQVNKSECGKIKRLWDSEQLEPLKSKVDLRKKYIPISHRQ